MPINSNPQDEDTGECATAPPSEYVTILKAELDSLRSRLASTPASAINIEEVTANPGRVESWEGDTGSNAPTIRESLCQSNAKEVTNEDIAQRRRLSDLERTCKAAVRDRELATSLAGRPLVAGAAVQLMKLWRDEFDVIDEKGEYQVVSRDGRNVVQAVSEWLALPTYAHFCLPTSRGGTGARDTNRPANPSAASGAPKNLGEAVVMRWREESAKRTDNLLKPIGLRRHR